MQAHAPNLLGTRPTNLVQSWKVAGVIWVGDDPQRGAQLLAKILYVRAHRCSAGAQAQTLVDVGFHTATGGHTQGVWVRIQLV